MHTITVYSLQSEAVGRCMSLEAGEGIPCRPNTAAALLVMSYYFFKLCLKMEIL